MPTYTQTGRPFRVYSPLGTDVLLLENVGGEEAISSPFEYRLDMLSENDSIPAESLIRKPVHVEIDLASGGTRYIHGLVSHFVQRGRRHVFTAYTAIVRPSLWFLSLWQDCLIFQNKNVPQILEKVFGSHGVSDYTLKLLGAHPVREYCVQYRETALDFVSRLMEEEGIFYFFEHTAGSHTLIVTDGAAACTPCPGGSSVRMSPVTGSFLDDDVVNTLDREVRAATGQVTLNEYNFLTPSANLKVNVAGDGAEEIYDYPGKYEDRGRGEQLAGVRIEEHETPETVVRGDSNCRAFVAGFKFDLKDHFRRDLNASYLLTRLRMLMQTNSYQTSPNVRDDYSNEFEAIPGAGPYRPPMVTRKPVIAGLQTALVVGPKGEEIYSDKYGRVKVQFYWDRIGKKDQDSSCWLRVSQDWAGKNWGAVFIPRIGQEVIVEFLEGDPDRPLITGRVYNAELMPPYTLPANQTQSGIKSRSTKSGSPANYNEFFFEDLKGSELIRMHAEKDLLTEVEHDETRTVDHDRTTTITNNETQTVDKGNETITLNMGNQSTTLKMGNQSTKAELGKISVEAMQSIDLKVGQSSIHIDQMGVTIKGMMISIEGQVQVQVKGVLVQVNADAMLILKGGITMIN